MITWKKRAPWHKPTNQKAKMQNPPWGPERAELQHQYVTNIGLRHVFWDVHCLLVAHCWPLLVAPSQWLPRRCSLPEHHSRSIPVSLCLSIASSQSQPQIRTGTPSRSPSSTSAPHGRSLLVVPTTAPSSSPPAGRLLLLVAHSGVVRGEGLMLLCIVGLDSCLVRGGELCRHRSWACANLNCQRRETCLCTVEHREPCTAVFSEAGACPVMNRVPCTASCNRERVVLSCIVGHRQLDCQSGGRAIVLRIMSHA